ncbi:MAG: 50S ribosomal protein L18 [Anaerolineae bacterium]|nr:MAG: 50S ribosomal protein L18 [Anaerolineae bacterium]
MVRASRECKPRWQREQQHSPRAVMRIRRRVSGTAARPRLNVFRSLEHIYAQIIDDERGQTLAAASTTDSVLRTRLSGLNKVDQAKVVGETIAQRALDAGIKQVVFDRGGYIYHGRIKALADASRPRTRVLVTLMGQPG